MQAQIQHYQEKLSYEIDSWDLNLLITEQSDIKILDCRSEEAYATEHIPTAINLPHRTISVESTQEYNRETLYISYCDGIGCNASTKGAFSMAKLGFRVKELMGGLDWWKRDGHATEGIQSQSANVSCGC